ncbi:MAG: hypothetical protein HY962_03365 [Ignavibacteriae bacterium]|nr:hypothetical protein [Ignavibacteriota bacterium]
MTHYDTQFPGADGRGISPRPPRPAALYPRRSAAPLRLLLRVLCVCVIMCTAGFAQQLAPSRVFDLNALRGNVWPNALVPGDIAVDESRHLAYVPMGVGGRLTVVDMTDGRIARSLPWNETGDAAQASIAVNPTGWMLLLRGHLGEKRLVGVGSTSGSPMAMYEARSGAPVAGVAVDVARNRVFVSDGTPLIRVLDGTSLRQMDSLLTSTAMNAGALHFDSSRAELLVLSRDLVNGRIHVQALYSQQPHALLRARMTRSAEPARDFLYLPHDQRLVAIGPTTAHVFAATGLLERAVQFPGGIADAAVCVATNTLYVVDASGQFDETRHVQSGKVHRVSLADFSRDSILVGAGLRHVAADQRLARLVFSSEEENRILLYDCVSCSVIAVADPGESADVLCYDSDREELYAADRLGEGDGVLRLRLAAGAVDMLHGAARVSGLGFDAAGRRLLALAHGESALRFVDPASPHVATVRRAHPQDGRTGDLAHLAYDEGRGLALVCLPEHEAWTLIDTRAQQVLHTGAVDGFSFAATRRPGRLQGALLPWAGLFVVLRTEARILNVYSMNDGRFLREVSLATADWSAAVNDEDLLYVDVAAQRLFVAGLLFEQSDFEFPPRLLPELTRVTGATADGRRLFGLAIDADSIRLNIYARGDMRRTHRYTLFPAGGGTPACAFDALRSRLFVSEPLTALVREYRIDAVGTDEVPLPVSAGPMLFPNPAQRGDVVTVVFPEADTRGMDGSVVYLRISDALGRTQTLHAQYGGRGRIELPTQSLAPGLYLLTLLRGDGGGLPARLLLR